MCLSTCRGEQSLTLRAARCARSRSAAALSLSSRATLRNRRSSAKRCEGPFRRRCIQVCSSANEDDLTISSANREDYVNRISKTRRLTRTRIASRPTKVLRQAERLLSARYGTPRLGNKREPISEIVFIILSARTRGTEHEAAYRRLRTRFRTWTEVRDAPLKRVQETIGKAGLSRIKAVQIRRALRQVTRDFGRLSASPLGRLDDSSLEAYLVSLPGVGQKTARCVMLYSLDRRVFPVDTHCMMLFENLGIIDSPLRFEYAQEPLQNLVPLALRYSLHVNAVAHGRETCLPTRPKCDVCPIARLCVNRGR